jgi:plastocyanin
MTMRSFLAAAMLQAVFIAALVTFPARAAPAAETIVKIDNFAFGPQRLTVAIGTTVRWENEDDIPHNIASTSKVFRSKVLDTHDSFSFTFTAAGVFDYFCSLHPHMTGTIVVEAATGSDAV